MVERKRNRLMNTPTSPEMASPTKARSSNHPRCRCILIAEDNDDVRETIEEVLRYT